MPEKMTLATDDVNRIVKDAIEKILGNETYKHSDVGAWSDTIVNGAVQQLANLDANFKYMVCCTIVQKNGAGLNTATMCYWNNAQDRYYTIRWENKHLHTIVHVFAIPL